jgi:hypothetical protein
MAKKYQRIKRTPTFIAAYSELRQYLGRSSPLAFLALPSAIQTILDVIDMHPRSWPIKRKNISGVEYEFHLAIINLAYRRLHIRYLVDDNEVSYLLAVWVDGHDEPKYAVDDLI